MTINKTSYGVIAGVLLPIITIYAFFRFGITNGMDVSEFFGWFIKINYASSLIAVSTLSDLALFMGFAYSNKMNFARGVFMATMFWVLVVIVFKFIIQG